MRFKHNYLPELPRLFGVDVNVEKRSIAIDFGHHTFFISFRRAPKGGTWEGIELPRPW